MIELSELKDLPGKDFSTVSLLHRAFLISLIQMLLFNSNGQGRSLLIFLDKDFSENDTFLITRRMHNQRKRPQKGFPTRRIQSLLFLWLRRP